MSPNRENYSVAFGIHHALLHYSLPPSNFLYCSLRRALALLTGTFCFLTFAHCHSKHAFFYVSHLLICCTWYMHCSLTPSDLSHCHPVTVAYCHCHTLLFSHTITVAKPSCTSLTYAIAPPTPAISLGILYNYSVSLANVTVGPFTFLAKPNTSDFEARFLVFGDMGTFCGTPGVGFGGFRLLHVGSLYHARQASADKKTQWKASQEASIYTV